MRKSRVPCILLFLCSLCSLGFTACGGGGDGGTPPGPPPNPQHAITSLSPSSVTAGASGFTLTVNGRNFTTSCVVRWNGSDRATTFQSTTQLQAAIPSSDVASAGSAQVTVYAAATGGGVSNESTFVINSNPVNPAPAITTVSPSQVLSGGANFVLTVNGSGFVQGSVVRWNGSDRSTTFVSGAQLTASIPAADIASTGSAQVTAFNPAPGGGTSGAFTFYVAPAGVGVVERVSVDNNGGQLPGDSLVWFAGISGDGRFVAFDFFPQGVANPVQHVFVRDTCRGAPAGCTPSTVQVSVADDGTPGDGANLDAAISADGRFVAFSSYSSNLVPGDTNGALDVILRDTCAGAPVGCTPSTTRVSVASDGTQGNGDTHWPTISADGRFVAFPSSATNLVPNDTNGTSDTFVRDTCFGAPPGCTPGTFRVSLANDGSQGNDGSGIPSISASGRFVAFDSAATNLVPGASTGGVFVRDTCVGASAGCTPSTTLASVANDGSQENRGSWSPLISANGRFVSFVSSSTNLVTGYVNTGGSDAFVRDTCFGAPPGCTPSTTLVSAATDGSQGNYGVCPEWWVPISGDGRFVAFNSWSTDMLPGGNRQGDIFVRDTCVGAPAGCTPSTVRVNVATDGSLGSSSPYQAWSEVAISADGRFVAFDSDANDLVPGDTNCPNPSVPGAGCFDVFLARTGAAVTAAITTSLLPKGTLATTYSPTLQARGRANKGASR